MTKKEAIEVIENLKQLKDGGVFVNLNEALDMAIEALKEVQKHEETFEWCHDCNEYDTENYCCHRWSKVIRNTVEKLKEEPPTIPCFTESAEAYKAWTGEEIGSRSEQDNRTVHIKNMNMPTACENCLLSNWTGTRTWKCVPQDRKYSEYKGDNGSIRQEGCPLISEVADRPHGEWYQIKDHKIMGEGYLWHCSICDYKVYQDSSKDYPEENYCPNCGAKMDGNTDNPHGFTADEWYTENFGENNGK